MTDLCFDSNILIDAINGRSEARSELLGATRRVVSIVTWIEVLGGCRSPQEEVTANDLFAALEVIPLDASVAQIAIEIRRHSGLRLADAVILATAYVAGLQLSTRNTKAFSEEDPTIRIPYRL